MYVWMHVCTYVRILPSILILSLGTAMLVEEVQSIGIVTKSVKQIILLHPLFNIVWEIGIYHSSGG